MQNLLRAGIELLQQLHIHAKHHRIQTNAEQAEFLRRRCRAKSPPNTLHHGSENRGSPFAEVFATLMLFMQKPTKNPAAVALGRLGGLKGGKARAAKLTPEQRSESARNAVLARWAKSRKKKLK